MNLLRGNHESRAMTEDFTFRQEVLDKFDQEVYEMFIDVFDQLPIAAHVSGKYLCVHGGISPDLEKLSQINLIDRKREIPMDGMLCDLMWSDPMEETQGAKENWCDSPRDCAFQFGIGPIRKL